MSPGEIVISARITIPFSEIEITYARSGGPGGQNVNKVSSKAVLRFNLRDSPSIPETARDRATMALQSRLTRDGALVISSSTHRDQLRNREAVLERFRELLTAAVRRPTPRVPTRPSGAARERRLTEKKVRARQKRQRQKPPPAD